ncbi:hypothetical protein LG047_03920 [Methylocystis sp. WRRC1]|uniref:hypothetical protein n=1 Tax=Methylocystis sp. WRRC1 TaxID=1732014 RepID=UPI001D141390|nr:hypothetical protein [Methylocystis sp. WRRC1]MCC3244475.1 hypothetical protein [Methylocystis sp. WRRC1]
MSVAPGWRTGAALLVIGLCSFTIWRATTLLRYGLAELRADAASAPEALRPFLGDITVGARARTRLLALSGREDSSQRLVELQDLLVLTPLASGAWLDLARARFSTREPAERISGALLMSQLTGRNEGRLMAGRAVFALPLWPMLPGGVRKGVISDLVGGWGEIADPQRIALRTALSVARDETRESVRAGLLAAGRPGGPARQGLRVQSGASQP